MHKSTQCLLIKLLDPLIYTIILFYACVGIAIIAVPEHKNIFTLISVISTICTLLVCIIFSVSFFSLKMWIHSTFRLLVFSGMTATYMWYLKTEFALISTQFNLGALSFDLFTSALAYLVIREFFERQSNDINN